MLEKIGLPAKPSVRGNNWVVDASHCQGCSSQFTFINRKHHCRRCGGLFCNNCTLQRMVLRGQGDSPVRICEPCKQLEEAARFELRYGHKNRAGKGSSRSVTKQEDEFLDQILGNDGKRASSSGQQSSIHRASSTSSHTTMHGRASFEEVQEISRSLSVDGSAPSLSDMESITPEELRQRALDEKKKYKVLKGEGKSDEALKAFKRGKELERQADALEISIRKNRKKALASSNTAEIEKKDGSRESGSKRKFVAQVSKEKDDLTAELQQLGWSDMDLHDEDKKHVPKSLESELSSLLGDISRTTNKGKERSGEGNSQVLEHKKRALALKRQGKLAEAKEELKKAKILEKQLEEQELLGAAEDSDDDEISTLIRSMGDDNEDDLFVGSVQDSAFDVDRLMGVDDIGFDDHMEVTDKDLMDPELAATLKSLGWDDDSDFVESTTADVPMKRAALEKEILSLKREALQLKRAGNTTEAMAQLKKAKKLEKDLESLAAEPDFSTDDGSMTIDSAPISQSNNAPSHGVKKSVPKSRMMIQKELLALKKKALSLRREGRVDEAEEELKKGRVLEEQLTEMDNAPKSNTTQLSVGKKDMDLEYPSISGDTQVGEEVEPDITDQDMHDPTYLSILRNLGWKDEENEPTHSMSKPPSSVPKVAVNMPVRSKRRSKAEVQRELLGLKRKALGLRREGKIDEADEILRSAKILEAEIAELEAPKTPAFESSSPMDDIVRLPSITAHEDEVEDDVTEKDMHDRALLSMLESVGWKDEHQEAVNLQKTSSETVSASSVNSSVVSSGIKVTPAAPKSKREIQRELLGLKRNALALRRKGETKEAEELLEKAKVLEAQLEELEGTQKDSMSEPSIDVKPKITDSLIVHEKKEHSKPGESLTANLVLDSQEKDIETFMGSRGKVCSENEFAHLSKGPSNLIPAASQQSEEKDLLLGESFVPGADAAVGSMGKSQDPSIIPAPTKPSNMIDLLTGDAPGTLHVTAEVQGEKFTASDTPNHSREILRERNEETSAGFDVPSLQHSKKEETEHSPMKPSTDETNSKKSASPNGQNLHDEVLARKRKAVALKREGKLSEAMEELRQAKLLEKSMDQETSAPKNATSDASTSMPDAPIQQKEAASGKMASKPVSGRDRFKIQQESLKHKRQAMKLRREGKMEEAEAEFELAKNLEAQLDEMSSQDTSKTDVATDGVMVEDLLDPQLRSALRAIGIEDTNVNTTPQVPQRPAPVNSTSVKTDSISPERSQLEERIKAEKVKAVSLKRQGKQAEALDALRRAKLYEKKLNSLGSN